MTLSDLIALYDENKIKEINFRIRNNVGYETTDWTEFEDEEVESFWFDNDENTLVVYLETVRELM